MKQQSSLQWLLITKTLFINDKLFHVYLHWYMFSYSVNIFRQLRSLLLSLIDRLNVVARSLNKLRRINHLDAMNANGFMIDRSAVYRYDDLSQFSRQSPISNSIYLPIRTEIGTWTHVLFQRRWAFHLFLRPPIVYTLTSLPFYDSSVSILCI